MLSGGLLFAARILRDLLHSAVGRAGAEVVEVHVAIWTQVFGTASDLPIVIRIGSVSILGESGGF